jgi:transcriptional regulator GlxA family with amidase domain
MKIAFIIFNNMTALDFIGVYDPLTRLKSMGFMPELTWDICAYSQQVMDDKGLIFIPTTVAASLDSYDLLVVPGGFGTRSLVDDVAFIKWLQTANSCKLKTSVCTGSLLLGAAGFLKGKKATTHPNAYGQLAQYCQQVVEERIIDEGDLVTARGVTSAIDLGLYLAERFIGTEGKDKIQQQMDYHC